MNSCWQCPCPLLQSSKPLFSWNFVIRPLPPALRFGSSTCWIRDSVISHLFISRRCSKVDIEDNPVDASSVGKASMKQRPIVDCHHSSRKCLGHVRCSKALSCLCRSSDACGSSKRTGKPNCLTNVLENGVHTKRRARK